MVTLNTTMTKMSSASIFCPRRAEITLATRRMMTSGLRNKCNNSNASAPRRLEAGSLGPYLERRASASCAVSPTKVAEILEASSAKAEGVELIELEPQTLFLLHAFQILRNVLKTDVSQVLIVADLVENGPPDGHLP